MGVLTIVGALILCFLVVKITEWWDNRKEEKERQREIELTMIVSMFIYLIPTGSMWNYMILMN